jgi:glycosyltransferase involved in cell wall biosynthesis
MPMQKVSPLTGNASAKSLRIVAPRFGANVVGGAETLAFRMSASLVAAGWRVEVLTSCAVDEATWRNEFPPGDSEEAGILVHRFSVHRQRRPLVFREMTRLLFRMPARLRPELFWVRSQGPVMPDLLRVLATHEAPTLFIPYLYHPTLVGLTRCRGRRILVPAAHDEKPLRLRAVGRMLAAVDGLLYGTQEERHLLEAAHPQAAQKMSAVGNVGVAAPPDVSADRFRERLAITGPYLLYGGRSTPGKGLDKLLTGLSLLRATRPEAQLVLLGEAGRTTTKTPGVLPVGFVSERARWDAIAGAAAVVVPSFHESLSLLALEAWALGRPAILNAVSPALAGQASRSGGAVMYRGPEGLAATAAALLDDPARGSRLGAAGRAYVECEYTWEAVHQRLLKLLAQPEPPHRREAVK